MYVALRDSGALAQLEADGVSGLFQFSVDNALCHVADPTFLGFCHSQKAECAALTVPKLHPHEPVGVLARSGGRPAVVEYSELSEEMKVATDKKGRLLYSAAHICIAASPSPSSVASSTTSSYAARHRPAPPATAPARPACRVHVHGAAQSTLPLHVAKKKIPCLDAAGALATPEARARQARDVHLRLLPGGQKGARGPPAVAQPTPARRPRTLHPADLTPRPTPGAARRLRGAARRVLRSGEERAGLGKADSPDTARAMISHLNRRRLEAAGAKLPPAVAGELIEVSPLVSYQGEGLGAYKKKKLEVQPALLIE